MNRTPTGIVPILFGTLALSAVIVAAVVGHPFVLVACLAVAVTAGHSACSPPTGTGPSPNPAPPLPTGGNSSPSAPDSSPR